MVEKLLLIQAKLNTLFSSVFTKENFAIQITIPDCTGHKNLMSPLSDIDIETSAVLKQLQILDVGKSAGPDDKHPKEFVEVLAETG